MANLVGLKDFETRASKEYRRAITEVERHMEDVLGDDTLLAWICGGGKLNFRNVFLREFRNFTGIDAEMPDMLWQLYVETWNQRHPHQRPSKYLDALDVKTPHVPTEQEIDDAWEYECASSEEARRYFSTVTDPGPR